MKYQVITGGKTRLVEVNGGEVVVDGIVCRTELRPVPGTPLRILVLDGASSVLPMHSMGRGQWLVQDAAEVHEVEVIDERAAHIRSRVGSGAAPSGPQVLKAPMPGLVVRVLVQPGDSVAPGQGLIVLEAMKMENELRAAADGVVERVLVAEKQAVEKGAELITFQQPAASN